MPSKRDSRHSRQTASSVPTYQQSLTSAQMNQPLRPTVQFSPPPPGYQSSGYNSVMTTPNTQMGMPPVNAKPMNSQSGYRSQASSRKSRDNYVCFDTRYAKSRQGIFKVVQFIIVMIAWICIACTPYMKRIFVQGASWPFHMVMFFAITGWLLILSMYILFTSGYHRRRKRKPWPTYELYFNASMIVWFFSAAMIESFHVWRWNYGPYKGNPNQPSSGMGMNGYGSYGGVNSNGYTYTSGWDPKMYCRQRPVECQEYMRALVYYNPYYPTHIFATVCLWITFCVFIASTWHAYTLHVDYKTFLAGMDSRLTEHGGSSAGGSTVFTKVSSKFSVGRLKKKKNAKPPSAYTTKSTKKSTKSSKSARPTSQQTAAPPSEYKAPSSIDV